VRAGDSIRRNAESSCEPAPRWIELHPNATFGELCFIDCRKDPRKSVAEVWLAIEGRWEVWLAIEGKSPEDLVRLAQAGARLQVDGRRYALDDLVEIAGALTPEGLLNVVNCEGKSTDELGLLVSAAPGRVMLA
jgi:hypothetical protein